MRIHRKKGKGQKLSEFLRTITEWATEQVRRAK